MMMVSGCDRLSLISSGKSPEAWLKTGPYMEISSGPLKFILMEPSSSILVYLLSLVTVGAGIYFLTIRENNRSRLWWGVSLILWGTGAFLAGTSYQALSYEIKCSAQEICSWTSWWEIYYMLFTVASVNAMMLGVSFSSTGGRLRRMMRVYALANTALYFVICLAGAFIPNKFLVSFELMTLFSSPGYVVFFIINAGRYIKLRERADALLMATWLSLGLIMAGYFIYFGLGLTETLWNRGVWFSANDLLHAGLIIWILYIGFFVAKEIRDVD